ncbi:unnamed protein product [Meloidogyne enterolobii]|uniref:Uncharacterized protein n=1 Tax=Meloidogyne enterolobii TaxID=390850 RepID=A0ACB0Y553_MELEN
MFDNKIHESTHLESVQIYIFVNLISISFIIKSDILFPATLAISSNRGIVNLFFIGANFPLDMIIDVCTPFLSNCLK